MHRCFRVIAAGLACTSAGILAAGRPAQATPFPGALYETFGPNGVSGLTLTSPIAGVGNLFVPATNIVAGNGMVYFESGNTIYSTTPTLQGLNTVVVNNAAATGLALDASDGILYESFGANGISAINATTGAGLGNLFQTATNIVAGNGRVYFENGNTVEVHQRDAAGASTVVDNTLAPAGLALDAADGILYESFGANGISGINLATGGGVGNLIQTATNLAYSGNTPISKNGTAINDNDGSRGASTPSSRATPKRRTGLRCFPCDDHAVPEPPALAVMALGLSAYRRARPAARLTPPRSSGRAAPKSPRRTTRPDPALRGRLTRPDRLHTLRSKPSTH